MIPRKSMTTLALLLLALPAAASAAGSPLAVTVSLLPQKYFVEKVGGPLVAVTVMVPAGADPHVYEPRPTQMKAVAQARLYFSVGVEFETAWLPKFKAANKKLLVIRTQDGVQRLPGLEDDDHHRPQAKEGHGQAHDPDHGLDPHIWLAPPLVKVQAAHVRDGLARIDPAHAAQYRANFDRFAAELDELDGRLKALFGGQGGKFMVFHPAWGYFARAYGLTQVAIERSGKEPTAKDLHRLIDQARSLGIKAVLVQPQFPDRDARTVAQALGGGVVAADDLAEDWAGNLWRTAEKIKAALR